MSLLNGIAENKEQFTKVWKSHVRELASLYRMAGVDPDKTLELINHQLQLVDIAAEQEFHNG